MVKMRVVDMHCDTIGAIFDNPQKNWTLADNELHMRLDKMKEGGYFLQNFALFVYASRGESYFEKAMAMADCFDRQMALFADEICQVRSWKEIEENSRTGKMSALLTLEEGAVCEGSMEKLHAFYDRGVRMMTLTWNFPNEIGFPNIHMPENGGEPDFTVPETERGLTEFGFDLIEEMQRIGMIVDVSHLSDAGFYDVASHAKKPFVASHSDARSVCRAVRNLTDDMIRTLAEKGGVTGLNYCADFLSDGVPGISNEGTLEAIVRHAKHIVNVGGEDCLGLGSDFDGIPTHAELPGADKLPLLDSALSKAGFTQRQREKIFSENVLRVYREIL
ncbi:MAG: dipeptidase [Eisenbergiella sp.]